jgi:Cysteine-rich CPCC
MAPIRHPCPYCGHQTLDEPSPGSWLTCPVCGWLDESGAGLASLERLFVAQRAQRSYPRTGRARSASLPARAIPWRWRSSPPRPRARSGCGLLRTARAARRAARGPRRSGSADGRDQRAHDPARGRPAKCDACPGPRGHPVRHLGGTGRRRSGDRHALVLSPDGATTYTDPVDEFVAYLLEHAPALVKSRVSSRLKRSRSVDYGQSTGAGKPTTST